jgi:hypothetical protein
LIFILLTALNNTTPLAAAASLPLSLSFSVALPLPYPHKTRYVIIFWTTGMIWDGITFSFSLSTAASLPLSLSLALPLPYPHKPTLPLPPPKTGGTSSESIEGNGGSETSAFETCTKSSTASAGWKRKGFVWVWKRKGQGWLLLLSWGVLIFFFFFFLIFFFKLN